MLEVPQGSYHGPHLCIWSIYRWQTQRSYQKHKVLTFCDSSSWFFFRFWQFTLWRDWILSSLGLRYRWQKAECTYTTFISKRLETGVISDSHHTKRVLSKVNKVGNIYWKLISPPMVFSWKSCIRKIKGKNSVMSILTFRLFLLS